MIQKSECDSYRVKVIHIELKWFIRVKVTYMLSPLMIYNPNDTWSTDWSLLNILSLQDVRIRLVAWSNPIRVPLEWLVCVCD